MGNEKIEARKIYSELFERIKRGYKKIICSLILFLALGVIYVLWRTPSYDAYASVLITSDSSTSLNMMRQFSVSSILGGSGSVYNEQKMLSSHTTMEEVMKETGLNISYYVKEDWLRKTIAYPVPPVKIITNGFDFDTLSSVVKVDLKVSLDGIANVSLKWKGKTIGKAAGRLPLTVSCYLGDFQFVETSKFKKTQSLSETITLKSYSAAAEDYLKKVEFDTPSKLADLITIYYKGKNKQLCIDLLQCVIDEYNFRGIDEYKTKESRTLQFINQRLETLLNEIYESEENLKDFKEKNGIADVQTELETSIEQFSALENELLPLQSKYEIVNMTLNFLSNPQNVYEPMPVINIGDDESQTIKDYNELIMERMRIVRSAKENNPSLMKIDRTLRAMRENILTTLIQQSKNIEVELNSLRKKNGELSGKLASVPSQEMEFYDIKREQYLRNQTYNYLIQLKEETAMNLLNTNGRGQIVDKPYISSYPTQKSVPFVLMAAFLLGLFIMPCYWYLNILIKEN